MPDIDGIRRPRQETLDALDESKRAGMIKKTANLCTPETWKISEKGKEAVNVFRRIAKTKNGLFASVPLICKGDGCPYGAVCDALAEGISPTGERCAREIAYIQDMLDKYIETLKVDEDNVVTMTLLKELIDCEIMIMRCDSLIANDANIIQNTVIGITEGGHEIKQPQMHKAVEMKNTWINARQKILNQLDATPKDKSKNSLNGFIDASRYASEMMARFKAAQEAANQTVGGAENKDNNQ